MPDIMRIRTSRIISAFLCLGLFIEASPAAYGKTPNHKISFDDWEPLARPPQNMNATEVRPSRRRLIPNPSIAKQGIKVVVLLVRFKDHANRKLPPRSHFEELFNGQPGTALNPVGSVKDYLRYSSLGKYRVSFNVRDWEDAEESEAFYAQGQSALIGNEINQRIFSPLLTKLDNTGEIEWSSPLYSDEFGNLNHMVVIHSGYGAEWGPRACLPEADPNKRIWSQASYAANPDLTWRSKDFYFLNGYVLASAFDMVVCDGRESQEFAKIGVMVHEYMHGFKTIDLYDDGAGPKKPRIGGTDKFDLMSNTLGWNRNLALPGHMSPYSRMTCNWLEPIEITRSGFYVLQPSEISGHVYILRAGFPDGEYLLIENRQAIKWDSDWPNSGLVIYHVDENVKNNNVRGYPGSADWPKNHYRVAVLQADGMYEIEKAENLANAGDFWTKGQTLQPGGNWPNTDAYQDGKRISTGISITVRSASSFIMMLEIGGLSGNGANIYPGFFEHGETLPPVMDSPYVIDDENQNVGGRIGWILSLFGGMGLMMGLVVLLV